MVYLDALLRLGLGLLGSMQLLLRRCDLRLQQRQAILQRLVHLYLHLHRLHMHNYYQELTMTADSKSTYYRGLYAYAMCMRMRMLSMRDVYAYPHAVLCRVREVYDLLFFEVVMIEFLELFVELCLARVGSEVELLRVPLQVVEFLQELFLFPFHLLLLLDALAV